jgi:dihydroxyacetone kinase-like protein
MVDIVLPDYPFESGDEVCVLINGMGATPLNELYVLFWEVAKLLDEKGISVYRSYVGNYLTSMDMMGASLTITKLDEELKKMIDMPTYSMGLSQR